MGIVDFFTRHFTLLPINQPNRKKEVKKFYATPSLNPSNIERNELLSLLFTSKPDSNAKAIRNQARSISTSSPLICGFFDTLNSEIFGSNGFSLDLHSPDSSLNARIETQWKAWKEQIPESTLDFWDIESLTLLYLKRDGECFVYVNETQEGLSLKIIDPDNIDEDNGITFDSNHRPIFYNVLNSEGKTQKISADYILHIFKRISITQERGVSALASVIYPVFQKDKFKSAELKRARLQSEITGFFMPNEEEAIPSFDNGTDEESSQKEIKEVAEVGKMTYIDKNLKPYFTESHNATNIEFFIKETDREIAKALGISYSTLTGDLNEVNYSSIRHGSSEQRRQFRNLQNFLIRNLHNKIFYRWIANEIKRGTIATNEYNTIIKNFTFKPQGWEYIDPYKETNANKIAIESGQKTLSEILREKGKELDSHIAELKKESEIFKLLKDRKK